MVLLLPLAAISCPLIMRVNPGPPPDFRDTGAIHRYAGGRWTSVPSFPGGVENLAIAPSGAIWTMTPKRDAVVRWDGSRWTRYGPAEWGAAGVKQVAGIALLGEDLWAATSEGVARFDGQGWRLYPEAVRTPGAVAIAAGAPGVWVIDGDANLAHFDGGSWTFENLRGTPAGADWDDRAGAFAPHLAVTGDGALWLMQAGLWRKDDHGWREIPVEHVQWWSATLAAGTGEKVWLSTPGYLFEVRPDGKFGRMVRGRELPVARGMEIAGVAATEGSTSLATSKDLLVDEGGTWRHGGLPPGTTFLKEAAAAPDGSVWVVSETRPIWRVALWVAPPLAAAGLALLVIGGLAVVWARGCAEKRWKLHRATMRAAGIVPSAEEAARAAAVERQGRALWWKLPAFLVGFPYLVKGVSWSQLYFEGAWPGAPAWIPWAVAVSPVALVVAFLLVRWLRQWSQPMPVLGMETIIIRVTVYLAVCSFFIAQLPARASTAGRLLNVAAFALPIIALLRNRLAARLTNRLHLSGEYDRALGRLRWLSFGRPSAWMVFAKGSLLSAAGRHAEAEQCYRLALSVAGNASAVFRRDLLIHLGYTLTDLGRYEEAQRRLETAMDLGDSNGGARLGIADLLLQQGKEPERALSLVEESLRICSAGWYLAERMGNKAWALALLGKREEMGGPLSVAMRGAGPAQSVAAAASIHWRAGKALAAAERVAEAIEEFRAAWRADPHGHHGQIARLELQHYGAAGA